MTSSARKVLPIVLWFLLAAYVIWRGVNTPGIDLDTLFAAWLGGVVSLVCVQVLLTHYRRRHANDITTTGA